MQKTLYSFQLYRFLAHAARNLQTQLSYRRSLQCWMGKATLKVGRQQTYVELTFGANKFATRCPFSISLVYNALRGRKVSEGKSCTLICENGGGLPVTDLQCAPFITVHHLNSESPSFVTQQDVTTSPEKPSFVINAHKILVLLKTVRRHDNFSFFLPRAVTNCQCNSSAVSGTSKQQGHICTCKLELIKNTET